MSIKQLRAGIRTWLIKTVRIDTWDLDVPRNVPTVIGGVRSPANCAIEMPVKDFGVERSEGYTKAKGRFVYALMYRFSSKASAHQLPMSQLENLMNYLSEFVVVNPRELWDDCFSIEINNVANPVGVGRVEGEDQDWLLITRLEMTIEFLSIAELDFAGGTGGNSSNLLNPDAPILTPTPPPITRIIAGVHRAASPLSANQNVLDRLLDIPYPEP